MQHTQYSNASDRSALTGAVAATWSVTALRRLHTRRILQALAGERNKKAGAALTLSALTNSERRGRKNKKSPHEYQHRERAARCMSVTYSWAGWERDESMRVPNPRARARNHIPGRPIPAVCRHVCRAGRQKCCGNVIINAASRKG